MFSKNEFLTGNGYFVQICIQKICIYDEEKMIEIGKFLCYFVLGGYPLWKIMTDTNDCKGGAYDEGGIISR